MFDKLFSMYSNMDTYFRKAQNLKAGEKEPSVVRACSPANNRSQSIEPVKREGREIKKIDDDAKIVRQKDLLNINKEIQNLNNKLDVLNSSLENAKDQFLKDSLSVKSQYEQLEKAMQSVAKESELAKADRLKQKLDSFIDAYNNNEMAHSEALKEIEKNIKSINDRVLDVEELLS